MRSNREYNQTDEINTETTKSRKAVKYIITVTNLALREGPGRDYDKLGIADAGQTLITEVENGYGKLADGSGWVSMQYVRKAD